MTKSELQHRLMLAGHWVGYSKMDRLTARALDQPQAGRPAGHPGHRDYSDRDYRRVVAWLRVHELCGDDAEQPGARLRREAARMLADASLGYVWISKGAVGWSSVPPVGVLRSGVATCWRVED